MELLEDQEEGDEEELEHNKQVNLDKIEREGINASLFRTNRNYRMPLYVHTSSEIITAKAPAMFMSLTPCL